MEENNSRRPIETRNAGWARNIASWLARNNVSPNSISLMSIVFSAMSTIALWLSTRLFYLDATMQNVAQASFLILAIVFIQLRLLLNMLDGMVAVEHNKKSVLGGLYNEIPDRLSDTLTLLGVGLAIGCMKWGWALVWLAIFLSVMTAYIRALGASLGTPHYFSGPMAKPHRMAFVCAGCIVAIFWKPVFFYLLIVMNIGLLITCYRRLARIVASLKQNA